MNHHRSTLWPSAALARALAAFATFWGVAALAPHAARAQGATNPPTYATDLVDIAAAQNGGRVVAFSTVANDDPAYKAENVIDGQVYNQTNGTGTKGWVSSRFDPVNMDFVTLGFANNSTHRIGRIVIDPSVEGTPGRWARHIQVLVSTETAEGPFKVAAELTMKQAAGRQEFVILPTDARFVRFNVRTNWGSDRAVGIGEIEIYETIATNDTLGQLISRYEGTLNELKRYRQQQIQVGNGTTSATTPLDNGDPATNGGALPLPPAPKPAVLSPETRDLIRLVQLTTDDQADDLPVSNVNIAAKRNGGKVAAYSSLLANDPNYTPDNLIDGQNFDLAANKGSKGWASEGFKPGQQYVTIGFAGDRTRLIGKLRVNPVSDTRRDRWARRIEVQATTGSATDGPWRTVTTLTLRVDATTQDFAVRPFEAKYVRFLFTANGPGDLNLPGIDPDVNSDRSVSLGEIEIYEATSNGDALDSLIGRFSQILNDLKTLRRQDAATGVGTAAPALTDAPLQIAAPQRPLVEIAAKLPSYPTTQTAVAQAPATTVTRSVTPTTSKAKQLTSATKPKSTRRKSKRR